MRSMRYKGDAAEAAENFARSLHDRWGVGDARCNNGVLLLISTDDRQIFISVGSGATSRLTYDGLGDIISDVRPSLKDRRYGEAVERAVVDIGLALAGRPVEPEGSEGRWWDELLGLGIFASIVGGFIFVAARTESRKRKRYQDDDVGDEVRKPLLSQGIEGGTAGASAGSYPGGQPPSAPPLPEQPSAEAQQQQQQQQQQRRPLVLPCGHAFCELCITQWLEQKKVTCPICRKPFDEDDSSPAPNDARDTPLPRPPLPVRADPANRTTPNSGSGAGPSSSSYFGPPWPPCSADDEPYSYVSPSYSSGMGTVPRLRLRWGSRRQPVRMHEDLLLAEMLFRLRQLQRQHPDYISTGMLHSWEQDLQNGREFSSQQLRQFQLNDPAMRREMASSGSSGTGVRFGGGSSRGGGGRGGSW
ncbi:hypothetical protein VOLCADRAFT_92125 [Volvox carteri f. nagariensis]|uniref:RING-type domain-containing protein n=1 Tax=Volvox carteri f. nagariensis TaxID=3068 RepID=D8TYN7_VOLCA|nr:uncharacterized protein VOLCADRAFT_92125 [Volvox carteri f. nagariensis]EFJ47425.1 hypothetical protein VOLCADRAFT_92125 [Volvox carteri f. nagariensis]|eukprot:XP_002951614.1 hypothetical protein VOLCADRAFT_92125 [Volvox carteri f. nagariensis]